MDCSVYEDLLLDEIDGELTEGKALSIMRHLVRCDRCRNEYSEYLALSEICRSSAPQYPGEVPANFTADVMALVKEELNAGRKVLPQVAAQGTVFDALLDKVRTISVPAPSLSWSLAASLVLIASVTFFYKGTDMSLSPRQMMTDAKIIKARVLKKASLSASGNAANDFNYYVNRHVKALHGKPVNPSMRYSGAAVSYVSHESGALRNK